MKTAEFWVKKLELKPHPEGGWFRESYRAAGLVAGRNYSTAIYFLLEGRQFSALHRIKSDEGWHFYAGQTLAIHSIDAGGRHAVVQLSSDNPQAGIPAGNWCGSRLAAVRAPGAVTNGPPSIAAA